LLGILSISVSGMRYRPLLINFAIGLISWLIYIMFVEVFSSSVDIHELSMSISIIYSLFIGIFLVARNSNLPKH
jgi:glucan phosphoethanolaminetransferase (alkaline phosphatase superfamily)